MSFWNNLTGADWQDHATYSMFTDALTERGWSGGFTTASSGAVEQAASWPSQLQKALVRMLDGYVSFTDPLGDNRWYSTNNLAGQTASAYGSAFIYSWASVNAAQLGGLGFTRKRPLEFATMAATTYDVSGASFVNGDNARCKADGIVYTRTAGAWVNSGVPLPDIFTVDNSTGGTTDLQNGVAQEGDIIGLWIYTELRDIINLMLHREETPAQALAWAGDHTNFGGSISSGLTQAGAEGEAETDYDGLGNYTSGGSNEPFAYSSGYDNEPPNNPPYGYAASLSRGTAKIATGTLLTTTTKTLHYFCGATRATFDEWDGNGDFTTEGIYQLITTASVSAATTSGNSAIIGTIGTKPAWLSSWTTTPRYRGYDVNDAVSGGTPYSTHSPVVIATYDFAYNSTT